MVLVKKLPESRAIILLVLPLIAMAAQPDAQVAHEFEARVAAYAELEKTQAGSLKATDSPDKLAEMKEQSAAKMRVARSAAKQGDMFSPEIADYFRRAIVITLTGHNGKKIRASLRHAEPVQAIPLQVNRRYPENVPLQSTPPTLLLNLPQLPHQLQYRIVGRDLVLYDTQTDLIVDFVQNAIPK